MNLDNIKDQLLGFFNKHHSIGCHIDKIKDRCQLDISSQQLIDIINELKELGLVEVQWYIGGNGVFDITPKGTEFLQNGGFSAQNDKLIRQQRHERNNHTLTLWKLRWFWISQLIAIVALAISLLAFIRTL